ncbi:hypothetical protein ACJX0J_022434, partial [Zea mays]
MDDVYLPAIIVETQSMKRYSVSIYVTLGFSLLLITSYKVFIITSYKVFILLTNGSYLSHDVMHVRNKKVKQHFFKLVCHYLYLNLLNIHHDWHKCVTVTFFIQIVQRNWEESVAPFSFQSGTPEVLGYQGHDQKHLGRGEGYILQQEEATSSSKNLAITGSFQGGVANNIIELSSSCCRKMIAVHDTTSQLTLGHIG